MTQYNEETEQMFTPNVIIPTFPRSKVLSFFMEAVEDYMLYCDCDKLDVVNEVVANNITEEIQNTVTDKMLQLYLDRFFPVMKGEDVIDFNIEFMHKLKWVNDIIDKHIVLGI